MRIGIVSGSGLCVPLLYHLKAGGDQVELYFGDVPYTDKDRDSVPPFCSSQGIPLIRETQKGDLYGWADRFRPDIIFVCGYAHKIQVKKLRSLPHGIYNIHYGKLPSYRGPNPVFWQLKNGEPTIGLSIHELTSRLDAGGIAWQHELRNEPHTNYSSVSQLFSNFQVQGVFSILAQVKSGQPVRTTAQDEKKAGYQSRPGLNDVLIRWASMSSGEIINLVKACNAWNYGAITSFNGLEVKLLDVLPGPDQSGEKSAGTISHSGNTIFASCCDGKSLELGFLSINGIFLPGRHAAFYGLTDRQKFTT